MDEYINKQNSQSAKYSVDSSLKCSKLSFFAREKWLNVESLISCY